MRKLKDLYKALALSTLKSAGFIADDRVTIEDWGKPEVLSLLNEGMTRLHSRFVLKTNNCIVEMREGRTTYPLLARYSYEGFDPDKAPYPYIMDNPEKPFLEDVIKILIVYDNRGIRRKLNDDHDPNGLFTPRPDVLQCMWPRHCEALDVGYQAKHPELSGDEEQEIDLPETLYSALENWVGYRYHTGLNTAEGTSKAAEYLQLYESICGEVVEFDLANGSMSNTNITFDIRGWV
jgi:hypothetical protein